MNKNNNKQAGFSLLELLIILVVVAMLVQLAAPTYTQHINKSRDRHNQVLQWQEEIAREARGMS